MKSKSIAAVAAGVVIAAAFVTVFGGSRNKKPHTPPSGRLGRALHAVRDCHGCPKPGG